MPWPDLPDLPPFVSIADVPFLQARERGGQAALHAGDETLTFAALDDRVRRFAAFLEARGVAPGSRVAILLPNRPELVIAYFGAIAAGAVAVPVNWRLSPTEVGYVTSDCGATVLVTTRAQHERLAFLPETGLVTTWVLVDGDAPGSVPFAAALERAPRPAPAPVSQGDVACLLYTSGTTGFPKGAMISHGNALFNVRSCRLALGYRQGDVGLVTLPLFHVTALHSQLVA